MPGTTLTPIITDAGLQAAFNASSTGIAAEITHIALGDIGYAPLSNRTALANERMRLPVADGSPVTATQIHLTGLAAGAIEFWVKEVGFYLADGTLFAVWSDPAQALAYKAAGVDLLLAFDLSITAIPAGSITVQGTGQNLSLYYAEELSNMAIAQLGTMHRQILIEEQLQKGGL